MKKLHTALIFAAALTASVPALAATPAQATLPTAAVEAAASADMVDGEIRKLDMDAKKITIKHGDIKNLDMPGMTMVFQVKDPALLSKVKVGDKVKFKAEKAGGAIVVTEIAPAK